MNLRKLHPQQIVFLFQGSFFIIMMLYKQLQLCIKILIAITQFGKI